MDFPRYVFTSEGKEKCALGTYGVALVEDKDEFAAAIKAGYKKEITDLFETPKKAEPFKKPKAKTFKDIEKEKKVESEDKDDF